MKKRQIKTYRKLLKSAKKKAIIQKQEKSLLYFIYEDLALTYDENLWLKNILYMYKNDLIVIKNVKMLFNDVKNYNLWLLYESCSYFSFGVELVNFLKFFELKNQIFNNLINNNKLNYINFITKKRVKCIDIQFRFKLLMLVFNDLIYCNNYVIQMLNFYYNTLLFKFDYRVIIFLYNILKKFILLVKNCEYFKS
ncbi:MAG: hypothetical protein QW303_03715, partial [Nitrososphaerota archaeon]